MIDLIVRRSGVYDKYYLDYNGHYIIEEVSEALGYELDSLRHIFEINSGKYDDQHDVYYFPSTTDVKEVISEIVKKVRPSKVEIPVKLTYEEIEYIRRALINEDSNVIFTGNKLRESIFSKLNNN
jgi:hypothetical protein